MAEFKSFNEFQKELHHTAEVPEREGGAPLSPEREEKPRRRFPRIGRICLFAGGAAAAAGAALFFLPVPIGEIRLHGNESVTMEDVLFDGAVKRPVNVLQIHTGHLEERLSKDIRIARVEVARSFPFYIDVTMTERKPLAAVQEEFGYAFLDREGMVIQTLPSIRGADRPMITGIKLDNVLLGDSVSGAPLLMALTFLGNLSEEGLHMFSEINVGNPDQITAYTRSGLSVRLGDGSQMADRARLAENMVKDVKARGLAVYYIDASLTSPYIKLKK